MKQAGSLLTCALAVVKGLEPGETRCHVLLEQAAAKSVTQRDLRYQHDLGASGIAGVEVSIRVARAADATGIGAGRLTDDRIACHEARARGDLGLSILEMRAVYPSRPGTPNVFDPLLFDDHGRPVARSKPLCR